MNKKIKTKGQIIAAHTLTYFNFLNIFLGALILFSGQVKNLMFLGVVVCNSAIGIFQELKVKKLVDGLSVIVATKVKLRIDKQGNYQELNIEDVKVGDELIVSTGDQLIADGVVIELDGVEIDESILTGESVPVRKKIDEEVFSGTFVVAGSAVIKVTRTGDDSYATKLVEKARTKKRATSEMQRSIKKIIKYVSFAIVPIGLALFFSQMKFGGMSISNSIVKTVAGVTGMIPEGLVLLTSVSFILGVGRLARKQALVQEMEAIEALARANVICLDKTGTITTGNLEVVDTIYLTKEDDHNVHQVLSMLSKECMEENATGKALIKHYTESYDIKVNKKIPFSSARKFLGAVTNKGIYLLGAPEFLTRNQHILEQTKPFAREGYRVLLLGTSKTIAFGKEDIEDFMPLCFVVISDEIKEDVKETFDYFKSQNVDLKIISGDNPLTVSIIAGRAGLEGSTRYVDAATLPEDEEELARAVNEYNVFGRVTPEQKQAFVKAFQRNGQIVSMVGDGVNDVLAIKDADCGIAMASGNDAAKQCAHIVLLNSDFSSMKDIVGEGRTIIANIERVSALYLTKTIYSMLLCLIFICFRSSYPFIPIQMTLIGATTIGIPSFFLTLEQNQKVTTGGFLKHILRISLPCALCMVAGLVTVHIIKPLLALTPEVVATCNLIIGGAVSFLVVFLVCQPINWRRLILCIVIAILFISGLLFFPDFFGIKETFLALW